MHLAATLILGGRAAKSLSLASPQSPLCRCTPTGPCWPNKEQWNALNLTLDGSLVQAYPVGIVCHNPNYDQVQCAVINANSHSLVWRAAQPGLYTIGENQSKTSVVENKTNTE